MFVARRGRSELTTTILAPGELADLVERVLRTWSPAGRWRRRPEAAAGPAGNVQRRARPGAAGVHLTAMADAGRSLVCVTVTVRIPLPECADADGNVNATTGQFLIQCDGYADP